MIDYQSFIAMLNKGMLHYLPSIQTNVTILKTIAKKVLGDLVTFLQI